MRTPVPLSRLLTARQVRVALRLALLVLLAATGFALLGDQPGLAARYFALGQPWEGRPFGTRVGEPELESASRVGEALLTKVVFSVRWSGWWAVEQAGEHGFFLDADDGGYLRIDDEVVVDTAGLFGEPVVRGHRALRPGFHAVEIGLYQTYGESRLVVHWTAPGATRESAAPLPLDDLYARRPLLLRQTLRRALASWPRAYRQLLGVALLLAAVLLLRGFVASPEQPWARLGARWRALDGRGLRAALLLALFVAAFFAVLPFTGTVQGGDDTTYLHAATFNVKTWFFNRYAHVYLLKAFTTLSGGDPLAGVRTWWSFAFAATVAALAVAVKSVGPGLQLRTLAVTLLLVLSQPTLFGLIGAGFADHSAMMFITVAVATCLHGLAAARSGRPPRHEWHALAIGALTVGAFRSKEVGAVLLLLPLLLLIGNGRLELRRGARRIAYWTAGAFAALLTLVILDGWILGDPLFTFEGGRLAQSQRMNFPPGVAPRKTSWFELIWAAQLSPANLALRNLWLGVCAAALVAGLRRRRLELRLVHLLPIAYLAALIVLYVRMPHPFSGRMLIPILPVACLMTGLLLHHAGLDDVPWREALRPGVLIPGGMAAAVVLLVVVPYRLETLEAASLLPVGLLRRYGWEPDHFVVGVLLPAAALLAVSAAALFTRRREGWLAALLVAYLAFFGVGLEITRTSLARGWTAQTGELLLYPWRTFRKELNAVPAHTIALSRDLHFFRMTSAVTRSNFAKLALRREDPVVITAERAPTDVDAAIASRYAYDSWRQQAPELAATAALDPNGFLVLVRPREAAEQASRGQSPAAAGPAAEPRHQSVAERLDELRLDPDPEAHGRLLREILDHLESPDAQGRAIDLQLLDGERLRAVGLSGDGWTDGARPAGLVVHNPDDRPAVQELRLTVHAAASEYPIRVFVHDGEQLKTVRFDRGGTRKIRLRPLPRKSSRLVLVWSDKSWAPRNRDDPRRLGVRIRAAAPR